MKMNFQYTSIKKLLAGLVFCFSFNSHANDFSSRENFNKLLKVSIKTKFLNVIISTNHGVLDLNSIHMEWLQIVVHLKIF